MLPSANAFILLESLEKTEYNLGDRVNMAGYILQDEDYWGKFQLDLFCGDKNPLLVRIINVKRGEQFFFDENLPLPLLRTGECNVIALFSADGKIMDQVESDGFIITTDLLGNFTLEDNFVQLGEDVVVNGNIRKINGEAVNGVATISLKQNGETFFVDNLEVKDGVLIFHHNTASDLSGDYNIDVEVRELFGNTEVFRNAAELTLVNEISVFVKLNKKSVLPGVSVTIFGEANTIVQEGLKKGQAIIEFGDKQFVSNIKRNGQFDHTFEIPDDAKSGLQTIRVTVEDDFGNSGEAEANIEVIPVPSELSLELSEGTFKPEGKLIVKLLLNDQAGDPLDESVSIEIIDPNRKPVFEGDIPSNFDYGFIIPEQAEPGVWRIKSISGNLEEEEEFLMGELKALSFYMKDQILGIKNAGNIKYTDPIEIKIEGNGLETKVTKRTSIKPEGELEVDLSKEVDTGTYDIEVGDQIFRNVEIIGRGKVLNLGLLYWFFVIAFLAFFVYIIFFRTRRKIVKSIKERRILEMAKRLKSAENVVDKQKIEFRNKLLKQIEKRDREIRKRLKFKGNKDKGREGYIKLGERKKEDKKESGGIFGMFD